MFNVQLRATLTHDVIHKVVTSRWFYKLKPSNLCIQKVLIRSDAARM
jgi:hypothetical protein